MLTDCADFYPKLQLRNRDADEAVMLIEEYRDELLFDLSEYDCSRSLLALYAWINETGETRVL
ncbi:MAG: hypothetical protein ACE5JV_02185, partial [Nitrososphaerales archaeon]